MSFASSPLRWAAVSLCTFLSMAALAAPPADTLTRIRQTRTVTLGTREAARPFSFLNADKQPVGYSVDLCLRAVEALKRELKMPDLKVNFVTVSGAERIPKLVDGSIDMECGSTTNTRARQEQVDFSYTIFVAGMKILTTDAEISGDTTTLAGKKVALSQGTTSEKLFNQMRDNGMQLTVYPSNGDALKALQDGKAVAFPQDDVLLQGMLSTMQDTKRYRLVPKYLSVEPYAIMVRKGDKALLTVIDRALVQAYSSGEINAVYARWFETAGLKVPMSTLTRDSISRPTKEPAFALILGYTM
ncbi:MAG: amino acid ABC transporter substrate-binding protein [Rhodocyclaceae bacterium]